MTRMGTVVLLALAASLGFAACGGSDDKKSADSGLPKAQLAAKADAICKTGEDAASAIKAPKDFSDPDAAAAYFAQVVPLHQKQTDDLAALEPDATIKADWDAFMATQNANNVLLKSILAKARAKDASGQEDLKKFTDSSAAFAAAATKIGSAECAGTAG